MSKKLLTTLALSCGLVGGMVTVNNTTASAAWHKGMPKAFIGKWKHHTSYQRTNGQTYECAYLFQGTRNGFAAGATYADTYYRHVRYNKYLGHHTYKILYNEVFTGEHSTAYLHWYSRNKVGLKWSAYGKYTTYNSRKPVYNYPYRWIG